MSFESAIADLFEDRIKDLPEYELEVGVIEETNNRKKDKSGITNAELMFIHEYGSPIKNIPPRPVLQMTVDHVIGEWLDDITDDCVNAYFESNFDEKEVRKQLKKWAIRIEGYAREIIYSNDNKLAPNRLSTARNKWRKEKHKKGDKWEWPEGNHPLFDTGQLARSIVCRLVEDKQ